MEAMQKSSTPMHGSQETFGRDLSLFPSFEGSADLSLVFLDNVVYPSMVTNHLRG